MLEHDFAFFMHAWCEGISYSLTIPLKQQRPEEASLTSQHSPQRRLPSSISSPLASTLYAFPAVFFLFVSRPWLIRSRIFSRSLSSLSLVTSTLLGAMPMGTLWPLLFSRATRSTCTTYLRR